MTRPIALAVLLAACAAPTPETVQIPVEWVETDVQKCLQPGSQGARWVPDPWGAEELLALKATVKKSDSECGCGAVRYVVEIGDQSRFPFRAEMPVAGRTEGALTFYLPGLVGGSQPPTYRIELTCSPGF